MGVEFSTTLDATVNHDLNSAKSGIVMANCPSVDDRVEAGNEVQTVNFRLFNPVAGNGSEVINFRPFEDNVGLPFPLYLHPAWKWVVVASFVVAIVAGTSHRKTIVLYLMSPEAR